MNVERKTPKSGQQLLTLIGIVAFITAIIGATHPVRPNLPEKTSNCPAYQWARNETSGGTLQCQGVPFIISQGQGGGLTYQTISGSRYLKISQDYGAFSNPLQPVAPVQSSLSAYYPMDEGTGGVTNDLSGNQNTGTLTNSPAWMTGLNCEFGNCLNFTAASTQKVLDNVATGTPSGTVAASVSAWADIHSLSTCTNTCGIGGFGAVALDQALSFGIIFANPTTSIKIFAGGGDNCLITATVPVQTFSFLAVTYPGSGKVITGYVNGVSQGTCTLTGTPSFGVANVGIGNNFLGPNAYMNGQIDDFRVSSQALTAIQQLQIVAYGTQYHNLNPSVLTSIKAILPTPLNASVTGSSITWKAEWDTNAADSTHAIWPIGADIATGGPAGLTMFHIQGGSWSCLSQSDNTHSTVVTFTAPTANMIHTFKITVTTAGSRVDYYVDSVIVCTITTNIPSGFLAPFTELVSYSSVAEPVNLWSFGGSV